MESSSEKKLVFALMLTEAVNMLDIGVYRYGLPAFFVLFYIPERARGGEETEMPSLNVRIPTYQLGINKAGYWCVQVWIACLVVPVLNAGENRGGEETEMPSLNVRIPIRSSLSIVVTPT
jgi:hypothetical protein